MSPPVYEYVCMRGHLTERFGNKAITRCEECGMPAKRHYSAPAVHFKGKGFYTTDYGRSAADADD